MKIDTNLMRVGSIRIGDKFEVLTFDDARKMCERPRDGLDGAKLYRIRALKDFGNVKRGDLGGYIEEVDCLSVEGDCWIGRNCAVHAGCHVTGNAVLDGNVELCGHTTVADNAVVSGCVIAIDCNFKHNSKVTGQLILYHCATSSNSQVTGNGAGYCIVAQHCDKISIENFGYTKLP